MSERGVFRNESKGRQLLKFQGIRLENITPSDIDGAIELRQTAWVFYEAKTRKAECEYGQKRMLYELTKDTGKAGKHTLSMIVEHDVEESERNVYLCTAPVREWISSEQLIWTKPPKPIVAGVATYLFVKKFCPSLIHEEETAMYEKILAASGDNGHGNLFLGTISTDKIVSVFRLKQPAWYGISIQYGSLEVTPDEIIFHADWPMAQDYAIAKETDISAFTRKEFGISFRVKR